MHVKAQQCDARYWEQHAEVSGEQGSECLAKGNQDTKHQSSVIGLKHGSQQQRLRKIKEVKQ
jgi:hypothetical protein